jgi:hypothetical protein
VRRAGALVVAGALLAGLAACGDEERTAVRVPTAATTTVTVAATTPSATSTAPAATAPDATTPAPQTTPAETVEVGAPPSTGGVGAGDEEAIRVPVSLTVGREGVTPLEVRVPAFLTLAVTARSSDGRAHTVTVAGTSIAVPAGGAATKDVGGLQEGRYPVGVDGGASPAALVVGGDAGP